MIHFIGIKGTGMASLAAILKDIGKEVQGSDLPNHFFTEDALVEKQIPLLMFSADNIQAGMTVIIGNAFTSPTADKPYYEEVQAALNNKDVQVYWYHQYLGALMKDYHSFAVAGSHGKTTTTTMLTALFSAEAPCGYLIGDGSGGIPDKAERLVVEACEYRRHFMAYFPDYAIITNVELDHVDYFHSVEQYHQAYEDFATNVGKKVVLYGDDDDTFNLKVDKNKAVYYGLNDNNDIQARNFQQNQNNMEFDVFAYGEFYGHFDLALVGQHLLADALACIAMAYLQGIQAETAQRGLAGFKGAKRRYVVEDYGENVFIDDYAHHSTEVDMNIKATKTRFPGKRIVAVFKPHRASRLVKFIDQYVEALKQADYSGVCEFTSIDDFDDGTNISVAYLTERVEGCRVFHETEADSAYLASLAPAVYLFMSSKDIYDFADSVKRKLGLKRD